MALATPHRRRYFRLAHAERLNLLDTFRQFHMSQYRTSGLSCQRLCDTETGQNAGMTTFGERLRTARKQARLNQEQLAAKAGLSQTTISDIERGRNEGSRDVVALARALGVGAEWLLTGRLGSNVLPGPEIRGRVPLISSVQAGQWAEIVDNFQPGDAEEWRETTARIGPHGFALRIEGDSMEPTILNGAVVIVDPARTPVNGSIVVVRQNGDSVATIKRLVQDGPLTYLKPDNPRYPIMQMARDAVIVGVAVKVEIDL